MTQKGLGFGAFPGLGRTLAALWFRSAALSFPIHEGEGSTTCRDCPGEGRQDPAQGAAEGEGAFFEVAAGAGFRRVALGAPSCNASKGKVTPRPHPQHI